MRPAVRIISRHKSKGGPSKFLAGQRNIVERVRLFSGIFSNDPYHEPVNFGEDFNEDNLKKTNGYERDIFLSALYIHSDPEHLFTKRIGSPLHDYAFDITVFGDDEYGRTQVNIFLLGSSSESPYSMAEDWK